MREIKNLFNKVIEEEYYKPIFVKESFNGQYKYYESRGDKRKELSVGQYFNMITPYSYDLINDHRIARRIWKIQICIHINFIFSRDTGETRTVYAWSDNVSIMQGSNTDDIIKEIFKSSLRNYQEQLKIIKRSDFVFECVNLMNYKSSQSTFKERWIIYKISRMVAK